MCGMPLGQLLLIVHTTHANRNDGNSTEQYVASNSCKLPLFRVMLWYNNPYHMLTGWVEASNTTGGMLLKGRAIYELG